MSALRRPRLEPADLEHLETVHAPSGCSLSIARWTSTRGVPRLRLELLGRGGGSRAVLDLDVELVGLAVPALERAARRGGA